MSKYYQVAILLISICVIFVLFGEFWPLGDDYFFTFRTVTESFFQGKTRLYDENSLGFYNAPWTVLMLWPIILLPLNYGEAILLVVSLIGILTSIFVVSDKKKGVFELLIIFLATMNMYTLDLFTRGNIDGILALGIGLSWFGAKSKKPLTLGCGFLMLSVKPMNVVLPALVVAKVAWNWSNKDKLLALAPLSLTFLFSFPIFGYNWPMRYIKNLGKIPPLISPQIALWRLPSPFGFQQYQAFWLFLIVIILFVVVLVSINDPDRIILALSLSLNLVFTPYALGSHYILLAPAFFILVQEFAWLILIWLFTLTPLILIFLKLGTYWQNILYPISLMLVSGYFVLKNFREKYSNLKAC